MKAFFSFFVLSIFIFLSGCLLEQQKPEDIFTDGKLPDSLNVKANPPVSAGVQQISMDGKLAIAVIDNGVDYNHPWLKDKIRYTWKAGKVVGAGADFLGNDNWAHPNLIDASLFSFSAASIDEGKITTPLEDPVSPILDINNKFMTDLVADLKATPELATSFFLEKINQQSFSLLAAHYLLNNDMYKEDPDDLKKAREKAFKDDPQEAWKNHLKMSDLSDPKKVEYLKDDLGVFAYDVKFINPWYMEAEFNVPNFHGKDMGSLSIRELKYFYYFPEFLEVLQKVYSKHSVVWKTGIDKLYDYKYIRAYDRSGGRDQLEEQFFIKLAQTIYQEQFGYAHLNPAYEYLERLCSLYSADQLATLRDSVTPEDAKKALITEKIDDLFALVSKLDNSLLDPKRTWVSSSEKDAAKKRLPLYQGLKQFVTLVAKNRGLHNFSCQGFEPKSNRFWDDYETAFDEAQHLFFARSSQGTSHGTHVAGVISAQHPDIQIVPVRVVTSQTEAPGSTDESIKAAYIAGLQAWLAQPSVLELVNQKYLSAFQKFPSTQKEQLEFLFENMKENFNEKFDSRRLDYLFVDEIVKAIQYVGENKIKLANMSLGTKLERAVAKPSGLTPEDVFGFLDFEYLKYQVGQAIQDYASQTLFLIAAGNDGNWVDGKTRSALPCDISSPSLKVLTGGESLPNNQVKNVLCVGSIGPEQDLSPFTNILLTDTPMIFSLGESINSTIKNTDCGGADSLFDQRYGDRSTFFYPFLSQFDDGAVELMKDIGLLPSNLEQLGFEEKDKIMNKAFDRIRDRTNSEFPALVNVSKRHFCLRRYHGTGTMSGTSMATPGVAGFVGRWLLDKMKTDNMTEADLYESADFTPEQIITKISAESPDFGGAMLKSKKITDLTDADQLNPLFDDLKQTDKQLKGQKNGLIIINKN